MSAFRLTFIVFLLISANCARNEKIEKLNCKNYSFSILGEYDCTYCLDSNFIDISSTLTIEHWGTEAVQRFKCGQDTITLSWYLANEPMDEAGVMETLLNHFNMFFEFKFHSQTYPQPDVEMIKNNSMLFFKASGKCNDTYLSVGYGIDNETLVNLMIFYDSKEENEAAHEVVDQLVQSLKITPVTVNGKQPGDVFSYNYLNLPQTMTKAANVITMTYTADGEKLTKAITGGATKNYISGSDYAWKSIRRFKYLDRIKLDKKFS